MFVPFEMAAVLLSRLVGVSVSARAVWLWVQDAGQQAMQWLEDELARLAEGVLPDEEPTA